MNVKTAINEESIIGEEENQISNESVNDNEIHTSFMANNNYGLSNKKQINDKSDGDDKGIHTSFNQNNNYGLSYKNKINNDNEIHSSFNINNNYPLCNNIIIEKKDRESKYII